jgi:hypothetical protein
LADDAEEMPIGASYWRFSAGFLFVGAVWSLVTEGVID